jgi:hypothetical protein
MYGLNVQFIRELLSGVADREATVMMVFRALLPLAKKAAVADLRLSPAAAVDKAAMARAIKLAVGRDVDGVILVSAADPFPKPSWVSEEAYRHLATRAFAESVQYRLEKRLKNRFSDDLMHDFGLDKGFARQFMVRVQTAVSDTLVQAFEAGVGHALGRSLPRGLAGNLRSAIFYLLAFAVAGNAERVSELSPLVKLMAEAVPIGDLRHDPRTWLVLCA